MGAILLDLFPGVLLLAMAWIFVSQEIDLKAMKEEQRKARAALRWMAASESWEEARVALIAILEGEQK